MPDKKCYCQIGTVSWRQRDAWYCKNMQELRIEIRRLILGGSLQETRRKGKMMQRLEVARASSRVD